MIRHIHKIEICEAYHLASAVPLPDGIHVFISDYMPFRKLDMVGLATVEVSDEITNRIRVWTTKITAVLPQRIELSARPWAFRLTDVCGRQYLVGTSECPYPVVNCTIKHADQPSGVTECILSITWKSTHPMLEIQLKRKYNS